MTPNPTPTIPTIGLIAPYITGVYYGAILSGVQQAARRRGVSLTVIHQPSNSRLPLRVGRDEIDGWVATLNTRGAERLLDGGRPVVTISMPMPPALLVQPDNHGGAYAAVQHLVGHGHRRIAFVGATSSADIAERFAGYRDALADAGIALDPELVIDIPMSDTPSGRAGGERLLALGVPCTAIAAGSDLVAIGVVEVLRAAGRRFPDDLAIVGFDDIVSAQTHDPPLTTVRQHFGATGARALEELVAMVAGAAPPTGTVHVETALVVRRSCGCAGHAARRTEAEGDLAADGPWAGRVVGRLAGLLAPTDPQAAAAWPSAPELLAAVERAALGGELPALGLVERFWAEAHAITADLTSLNAALTALEGSARRRLAETHDPAAAAPRLLTLLETLREVLLRTCVAAEARQIQFLDQMMNANLEVSTTLLGSGASQRTDLSWLRHMDAEWGYLALWTSEEMDSLAITASYSGTGGHPDLTGRTFRTERFPPRELLTRDRREGDITIMMPVRSPSREWGILVLGGPLKPQVYSTASPTEIWAGMLGTELDRAQALSDLRQQQESLRGAYERERMLADTIRELSSPTIPLLPGVLLLPLIGSIDSERARLVIQAVLDAVSQSRATEVLIDITGVPMIDSQVANVLVQMARMVGLLGARCTLVGVRPEIAQSIVGLGADLSGIRTSSTLAAAIAALTGARR